MGKLEYSFLISMLLFSTLADACEYFIDHQSGRFVGSILSQDNQIAVTVLEHYFKTENEAQNFLLNMPPESTVEKSDIEHYIAKVSTTHELGKDKDGLFDWFSDHYRLVCSYNGVIDNWIIKGEKDS